MAMKNTYQMLSTDNCDNGYWNFARRGQVWTMVKSKVMHGY